MMSVYAPKILSLFINQQKCKAVFSPDFVAIKLRFLNKSRLGVKKNLFKPPAAGFKLFSFFLIFYFEINNNIIENGNEESGLFV